MRFSVIDKNTGEYPDLWEIALKEEWAKDLCYCDMEGFAIEEDGTLILLDECGRHEYCPGGRFEVVPDENEIKTHADKIRWSTDEQISEDIIDVVFATIDSLMDVFGVSEYEYNHDGFKEVILKWLKSDIKE